MIFNEENIDRLERLDRKPLSRHIPFFSLSVGVHIIIGLALSILLVLFPGKSLMGSVSRIARIDLVLVEGRTDGDNLALEESPGEEAEKNPHEIPSETDVKEERELDEKMESGASDIGTDDKRDAGMKSEMASLGQGVPGEDDEGGSNSAILDDYILKVRKRIERKKGYPGESRRKGEEGTVTVSFVLDFRGNLLSAEVVSSSGHEALDTAAVTTVRDASPYPPFPEELTKESLSLNIPIRYEIR